MTAATEQQHQFPCRQCGANLQFEPGQSALKCPYCQTENQIPLADLGVGEADYLATLANLSSSQELHETLTVKCTACGAESTLKPDVTSDRCPFCGSPIVAEGSSSKQVRPWGLLPFHIKQDQAMAEFRNWVRGLWFAPNDLCRYADANPVKGVYIPYWTYDCQADTIYQGQRGDDYQETETYTEYENGKPVTRTRTVTKTRWTWVSGRVDNAFDDLLVLASSSLPRKYTERLEPWDLENLVSYQDEFLAGFVAESYQIDLPAGFELAKGMMDGPIRQSVCHDIGGDHQRIDSMRTQYLDITFKHILLPLWISAYLYRQRTFRFLVNARSGEVSGERPYSAWKIFFLILSILAVAAIIALIASQR